MIDDLIQPVEPPPPDETKRQLKTCELCGKLFTRPVPRYAREGLKHCPVCVETGPTLEMIEKDSGQSFRSFRITGCKFRL